MSSTAVDDPRFLLGWSALAGVHWPRLSSRLELVTEIGYVERGYGAVYGAAAPAELGPPVAQPFREETRYRYVSFAPLVTFPTIPAAGGYALVGPRLNVLVSPLRELGGQGPARRRHVVEASAGLGLRSRSRVPLLLEARYNHGLSSAVASGWLGEPRAAVRQRSFDVLVGMRL